MPETPQQYTQRLLGYVEGQQPLRVLRSAPAKFAALAKRLDKRRMAECPAPGKWSAGEILAHLADTELAVGWRLRLILSNNACPVQAYDQDVWANYFNYRRRDPKVSLETFRVLRAANLLVLKLAPKSLWENYGMHEERGKETITHIVRLIAGHDLNHLRQIESIVKAGKLRPAKAK